MNIHAVTTEIAIFASLSQVMNDITSSINHESEITHVDVSRVTACKPGLYPVLKLLYRAHVKKVLNNKQGEGLCVRYSWSAHKSEGAEATEQNLGG